MSKSNPRVKCPVCRLVHQMDEVRKHPNGAGLRGITGKLTQIRKYTDMENWCAEHTVNYRDVTYMVEHWSLKLLRQLESRPPAIREPKVVFLDHGKQLANLRGLRETV